MRRRTDITPPSNLWRIYTKSSGGGRWLSDEHTGNVTVGTAGELYLRDPGRGVVTRIYAPAEWRSADRLNYVPEEASE